MDYPYQYAAVAFDGNQTASGEADIGFKTDGSTPFTVDAFVRVTEKLTEKVILSQPGSFCLGISGNKLYFRLEGFPELSASEEIPVPVGDWVHVCAVYGKPATTLYVNGIKAAGADLTGTGSESNEPFVFFRDTVGELRQVRFFDQALTTEEIRHYMMETEAAALPSLAAYFDFSRIPAAETVRDLTVETADASQYRLYSKGALFLSNTFASIDKEPLINPGGKHNDPYTVQAWVYFQESEDGVKQTVFSNRDVQNEAGMSLYIEKICGEYKAMGLRGSTGGDQILTSAASVSPKQWVNLALVYSVDAMELYIDGALSGRLGGLFPIEIELEEPGTCIGAEVSDSGQSGQNWLEGCISRLDIWERKMDADEIAGYAQTAPEADAEGLRATYAFHVRSNVSSCTGTLLGEHNQFSYGEISYPFPLPDQRTFPEAGGALADEEDAEPFLIQEQQWYMDLFMILIGGLADIVYGVKIKRNDSLVKLLTPLSADSTVRTMFADSDAVTASVLKSFYVHLYQQNLLNLALLAAFRQESQWWKVTTMIAESEFLVSSWIIGVPTAYYLDALTLLADDVRQHIRQKPTETPKIGLSSVQFSHSSETYTLKHLQLDAKQNIAVPEWASNRTDSAHVAYVIDEITGDVAVKAIFDFRSPGAAVVKCRDISESNMFGDSEEITVTASAKGQTESYDIIFRNHKLGANGVRRHKITLAWECREIGQEADADGTVCEIINTEIHLYVLMSQPSLPWNEYCRPDIKVLEKACEWSHNARSLHEIAAAVTEKVYKGLKLEYGDGTPVYVREDENGPYFELARFMNDLDVKKKANSTDCAAITATFANALGCSLSQKRIGSEFMCNSIRLLRGLVVKKMVMEYHDVCMLEPLQPSGVITPEENDYLVYDSCLELNGSLSPTSSDHVYWIVTGTPFSRYSDDESYDRIRAYDHQYYREHLARLSDAGFRKCQYDQAYNSIDSNIYKRIMR